MGYNPNRRRKDRARSFRDDLVTQSCRTVQKMLGADEKTALEVGQAIARAVCDMYAKTYMYVPSNRDIELEERAARIWAAYSTDTDEARKFTLAKVEELAKEHDLSTVQIYNIIRHVHREEVSKRQLGLPGLDSE